MLIEVSPGASTREILPFFFLFLTQGAPSGASGDAPIYGIAHMFPSVTGQRRMRKLPSESEPVKVRHQYGGAGCGAPHTAQPCAAGSIPAASSMQRIKEEDTL